MPKSLVSRREVISNTLTSVATSLAIIAMPDFMFAGQEANEELVPFQNEPPTKPDSLNWGKLTNWLTPQNQVFSIRRYGIPAVEAAAYELEICGLVDHPQKLSIDGLKSLRREDQFM